MAIIWSEKHDGVNYQVRQAGHSIRLYSNGVFHSQYNTRHPAAGSVWDMLFLPAFLTATGKPARVLVLGVGGGAVIKQFNHFFHPDLIVGVELNPVHLRIAKDCFAVDAGNVLLCENDAVAWVENYQGPGFDVVIDDLFGERHGQPCRAVAVDEPWTQALERLVNPGGVVVVNFDSVLALRQCYWMLNDRFRQQWQQGRVLTTPNYENKVLVMSRESISSEQFDERLQAHAELDRRKKTCRLQFAQRLLFQR